MKKKLFILLSISTLSVASCSKDESVNIRSGKSIEFRTHTQTRVTTPYTTNNLDQFQAVAIVDGKKLFDDTFTKGNDNYFSSTDPHNWLGPNEHHFYAYAPISISGIDINENSQKITDFTINSDISAQVDLITARATGSKAMNEASGVELQFSHELSQVHINAKNGNSKYTYTINGVKIAQIKNKNSFDFTSGWGEIKDEKATYIINYEQPLELTEETASLMSNKGSAMLMPQQLIAWNPTDKSNTGKGAYISVNLQIKTSEGVQLFPASGEYAWAAVAIDTKWEKGKSYIYTLDFTKGAGKTDPDSDSNPGEDIMGEPIKFTVKVSDWDKNNNEQDITM